MPDKAANMSFFGSIVAAISGFTINDWSAIFGILFGLGTFLINLHYKRKEDIHRKLELEIEMQKLRKQENEKN
ncbi:HP1 family phage holin [Pasteurella skyensis]|uniref:HP1 family phage holin n=1 Tax=Phocoenobacter skyensis TaxID=97481 RepID=A0AAJ6NAJ5_9PAST|nr:HP1 family phage holin [Pasteurella skyensis]MDP8173121.1 HP1 family phage holin [Pasteurella skyensis]MDP8178946.1 HP1 family phage holin [Pasteurella skyensis]